jgi:histidinol-phosphate aminotransferase
LLNEFENLVVLQTFSKAWGLAGIRLGMAFSSPAIVALMNKVKPPYNINELTQRKALESFTNKGKIATQIALLRAERQRLANALNSNSLVERIYPSDANFIFLKTRHTDALYNFLVGKGIVVRNRNNVVLCASGLRITIGTPEENLAVVAAFEAAEFHF